MTEKKEKGFNPLKLGSQSGEGRKHIPCTRMNRKRFINLTLLTSVHLSFLSLTNSFPPFFLRIHADHIPRVSPK